jgi:hypothetical protein
MTSRGREVTPRESLKEAMTPRGKEATTPRGSKTNKPMKDK